MLHFIRKLKSIHPDMIVSQPTYGYPQVFIVIGHQHTSSKDDVSCHQVQAEIDVVNGGWTVDGVNRGLVEGVGLMVYEGTQVMLASHWSILLILAPHWSILLVSHWLMCLILASYWLKLLISASHWSIYSGSRPEHH